MAEYVNPDTLVDTDWVAAHGGDAGVRLVEVDVDTTSYDSGHISRRRRLELGNPALRRHSA